MGAFPTAPPSVIMHLRRSLWPHNVPYQRHSGLLVRASFASEWGGKKKIPRVVPSAPRVWFHHGRSGGRKMGCWLGTGNETKL